MNSIPPISLGNSAAATPARLSDVQQRPMGNVQQRPEVAGASTAPVKTAGAPDATAMNLIGAVNDLLEGLGGDLQNNQILRMLMGLIILMAMLTQQAQGDGTGQASQQPLGGGGQALGGSGQGGIFLQQSYSYTSISIEQTSITSLTVVPPDAFTGGSGIQNSGGQIDLAV